MNTRKPPPTLAERYDLTLKWAHDKRVPPGIPQPQPTRCWPAENVRLFECYHEWLCGGGLSPYVIHHLYIPMAGHVLGLNLKPHAQLDLEHDLARAWDYVCAKQLSAEWTDMCRNALDKFRLFLRQQRGAVCVTLRTGSIERYRAGLPEWLVVELERYQHLHQSHWRPGHLLEQIPRFWSAHTRIWKWLCAHYEIPDITALKRRHVLAYVDERLASGTSVNTVNTELRYLHTFLLFLRENDYPVSPPLLRIPHLKAPDALPKFLTDEEVRKLRDHFEARTLQPNPQLSPRDAHMDRAAFYLLWQAGLRSGEVEELHLEDLDLSARKLTVRQGKGQKDRTVYLTDTTVKALQAYLAVRGQGPDGYVFLFRNQPLKVGLLAGRIKMAGARVGVKVYPHRLRHTCATQLLNAGCRVTSLQKFLGHQKLNSTMIYARVHERTVAEDYYAAMSQVEQRLELATSVQVAAQPLDEHARTELMNLVETLAQPQMSDEIRRNLAARMRDVLTGNAHAIHSPDERENRKTLVLPQCTMLHLQRSASAS